ncbi:MAG: 3-dehydroquinate synthase [Blautia sp.]|nr:3-dehydroquinate synthase [Blautia sp.]
MLEKLYVQREKDFTYPICFENSFEALPEEISAVGLEGRQFCLVTDSNVSPLYAEEVAAALRKISGHVSVFTLPAGEENKNLSAVADIYRHLIENGMDRKGILAALGGGVTGDITGFAAATYLRGIDFIQIPTTLLAQVDSSVGGKTGVDMDNYKNMVGAFHQPLLVYMNLSTLRTLPEEEFACGMGEVLKTGLICDGDFFRRTAADKEKICTELQPLAQMVRRCCEIKAGVVMRDPKETGERARLNLGHTIGHAVEKLKNFSLKHGQCVGLGLIGAARISYERGLLTAEEMNEIRAGIVRYGLPDTVSGLAPEDVLAATKKDKKMDNGRVRFILMRGIGDSVIDHSVTDEELLCGIREILAESSGTDREARAKCGTAGIGA